LDEPDEIGMMSNRMSFGMMSNCMSIGMMRRRMNENVRGQVNDGNLWKKASHLSQPVQVVLLQPVW